MLNEKIIYYRKKNMLTQEELAYQLNVSRQTITKWEAGIIYPNVEYLIKLSNLFSVSVDALVKEDDCLTLETHKIEINELASFLVKAKKATYANKKIKSALQEKNPMIIHIKKIIILILILSLVRKILVDKKSFIKMKNHVGL